MSVDNKLPVGNSNPSTRLRSLREVARRIQILLHQPPPCRLECRSDGRSSGPAGLVSAPHQSTVTTDAISKSRGRSPALADGITKYLQAEKVRRATCGHHVGPDGSSPRENPETRLARAWETFRGSDSSRVELLQRSPLDEHGQQSYP